MSSLHANWLPEMNFNHISSHRKNVLARSPDPCCNGITCAPVPYCDTSHTRLLRTRFRAMHTRSQTLFPPRKSYHSPTRLRDRIPKIRLKSGQIPCDLPQFSALFRAIDRNSACPIACMPQRAPKIERDCRAFQSLFEDPQTCNCGRGRLGRSDSLCVTKPTGVN